MKNYLAMNHGKFLKKMNSVNFQDFKRLARTSLILHGDFNCILILPTSNSDFDQCSIGKEMRLLLLYQTQV